MVARFLLFSQWMKLGFLGRDLAVGMKITQAQITGICQATNMLGEETSAFFEQFKIMLTSIAKGWRKDHLCLLLYNQLRFLGVPLLFAAVVLALLFFGRSICYSVASISTT